MDIKSGVEVLKQSEIVVAQGPNSGREGAEYDVVVPFLKWAGGKRWLTTAHPELLPAKFDRYIEPFLGSGAVFFHLKPKKALLADYNAELINAYEQLKSNWRRVAQALVRHQRNHSEEYYYRVRACKRRVDHEKAAQFIYLNRVCWNGLYRVNLRGEFNVPIGTKTSVLLPTDNFQRTSELLKSSRLVVSDFEPILDRANAGDFVFIDPPYVTRHNLNGFVKYNDKLFLWTDQERLCSAIERASSRGAMILITNANHESIRALYRRVGKQVILRRQSVLAADSANRSETTEVAVIINYEIGRGQKNDSGRFGQGPARRSISNPV